MISDIHRVTGRECLEQARYLDDHSDVRLGHLIRRGLLVLEAGVITSNRSLGEMPTIFRNLGGLLAHDLFGRELFAVAELGHVLHRDDCNDERSRRRYDELVEELGAGRQEPNITIDRASGIIQDGNKTAGAFHQIHLAGDEVELPVYLVRLPLPNEHGGCA